MAQTAKDQLASLRKTAARLRTENKGMEQAALDHLSANAGGLLAALVARYVPIWIPGAMLDGPALGVTVLLFDVLAAYSGQPAMLAASHGYEGYMTGTAIERAMGWRAPLLQAYPLAAPIQ
jgi:hypothetical protein